MLAPITLIRSDWQPKPPWSQTWWAPLSPAFKPCRPPLANCKRSSSFYHTSAGSFCMKVSNEIRRNPILPRPTPHRPFFPLTLAHVFFHLQASNLASPEPSLSPSVTIQGELSGNTQRGIAKTFTRRTLKVTTAADYVVPQKSPKERSPSQVVSPRTEEETEGELVRLTHDLR